MNEREIKTRLRNMGGYHGIFVDEFTWGSHRIDAIIIDLQHRWIRGFEIKISRTDFLADNKWTQYTEFLSSLSIVCPEGLISPEEIHKPLGLLWLCNPGFFWKKRPRAFQTRHSLAWLWTYVRVLEKEFPRLYYANEDMASRILSLESRNLGRKD